MDVFILESRSAQKNGKIKIKTKMGKQKLKQYKASLLNLNNIQKESVIG
jgi:hypothetical protein